MVNNNVTSIKSLRSKSLFEQPIMIDGVELKKFGNESAVWDIDNIFTDRDWQPRIKVHK